MSTLESLALLGAWYVPGFVAAAHMARRGSEPLVWIYAAWIGGALTAVAAVVVCRTRPRPAPDRGSVPRTPAARPTATPRPMSRTSEELPS